MNMEIKAVQLDLARQPENLEFIKDFCAFIANNGFNTMLLYLEGRIRTKSFPYPSEAESYSVDDMKEIVAYAGRYGIDIIPVVSTLGHAESFLKYKEMDHLGELRNGVKGRFNGKHGKLTFCPSLAETYGFLESYLGEIASIFPSSFFHAGCDESWDIACCDLCKQRLHAGETQADLFAAHIIKTHDIISKKLGKRVIIWDDMFEQYPEALKQIPKDIVMCTWNYSNSQELPIGHFNNSGKQNQFDYYSKNGFDYIFATSATIPNIKIFTRYAKNFSPLGGIVTTWELQNAFIFRMYPAIAFAGELWKTEYKAKFADIVRNIFKITDPEFVNALEIACSGKVEYPGLDFKLKGTSVDDFLSCSESDENYTARMTPSLLLSILCKYAKQIKTKTGKNILEDINTSLKHAVIQYKLEAIVPGIILKQTEDENTLDQLLSLNTKIDKLAAKRIEQWNRWRNRIIPCNIENHFHQIKENIKKIKNEDISNGFLQVYFCQPDQYGAQTCRFSIKYKECSDFEIIASGIYKSSNFQSPYYSNKFKIPTHRIPEAVKIETWGYGGQGFTYLKIKNMTGIFIPDSNIVFFGKVSNYEHMLDYDQKWCFTGSQNIHKAVVNPEIANQKHGFILSLKKSK